MPDALAQLLIDYRDALWLAFLGALGSVVRLAIGVDQGVKLTPGLVISTLISGIIFASLGPSGLQALVGLPDWALGASGFIWGLIGVAVATLFVKKSGALVTDKEKP